MTDIHLLTAQTETDRKRLLNNFKEQRKDFRLELIITGAIWLVAPFLTNRPNQKPLIESMSYGEALLFFGLFLLIPLSYTYFKKLHKAVLALQTDTKRIIVTQVLDKVEKPLFRKHDYCLHLADGYVRKLYFPRHKFDQFEMGEPVRIELSENGRQVIRITKATERIIERLAKKAPAYAVSEKRSYKAVLFETEAGEEESFFRFFSFLVPSKHNFVSAVILDINILVFMLMLLSGVSIYKPLVIDIINWGGNSRVLTLEYGEYWRLLTNVFVHIGIMHLLMNAIGFIFVSVFIEQILGKKWFVFLYLLTGLCASLTSIWWHANVVSAGASGAIFGLYGFFLALLVLVNKKDRAVNGGMITTVLLFVGYNLVVGLTGNIDNAAHIGGFITGFISGAVMLFLGVVRKKRKRNNTHHKRVKSKAATVGVGLTEEIQLK
jgi:rhomboid protease GluP